MFVSMVVLPDQSKFRFSIAHSKPTSCCYEPTFGYAVLSNRIDPILQDSRTRFSVLPLVFGDSAVIIKGRIKTKLIRQWEVGRQYLHRHQLALLKIILKYHLRLEPFMPVKGANLSM